MKKLIYLCFTLSIPFVTRAQYDKQAKQLDSIFTMLYEQNQFNGSVIIVEKGKILLKKGYGNSNESTKKKNNPQTIFELGSCTKQFTAAAVMLLKRQGKLSYTDPLSKYIPELSFWGNVTIYDLLRHTSGIPEYIIDMPKSWDKSIIASNDDIIRFYAQRKDSLKFTPGSRHKYTNTNYALLANIIEKTSGKSYADFVSENIFVPLGMNKTFVYNPYQKIKKIRNYAPGYVWAKNSFIKITPEKNQGDKDMVYYLDGIVGASKVHSNTEDLFLWIEALKNNTFFTAAEFDEMTEMTTTSDKRKVYYGFGLDVVKGDGKFSFGHTGSWGGYATFMYYDMQKDRTVITLQNFKMGTYPFENIRQILDGKPLVEEFRRKVILPESEIKKYTGSYTDDKNPDEEQLITYLDGHLVHNSTKIPWDMRFFPVSANEFQGVRQGGADGVLRFTTSKNGEIKLEMLQYDEIIGSGIKKN